MKLSPPRSFGVALGVSLPVCAVVAAACLLGTGPAGPCDARVLHAFDAVSSDVDSDGLTDREENVLQSSGVLFDTDGDGFGDGEELARGLSRLFPDTVPVTGTLSMGISASLSNGTPCIVMAIYAPDGELRDKDFRVGFVCGNRILELSREELLSRGTLEILPALDAQAIVAFVRISLAPNLVQTVGSIGVFATIGVQGTGVVAAACSLRIIGVDGVALLPMPDPYHVPPVVQTSGFQGPEMTQQPGANTPGGTIFVPLTEDEDPPALWTLGQICYQKSSPVGAVGMLVTHEVTRADCMDNWDASCPSSCTSSVGTTFTDIDPLALIGG